MINFLRTTFTSTEKSDIAQEQYVGESQRHFGKKATSFVTGYQQERQWKQNYILINIIAEGYDQKRFIEFMQKEKDSQPNIDFFTRDELKKSIESFKEKMDSNSEELSRSNSSVMDNSTAQMFDQAMNRGRTQSQAKRQQAKVADETILNKSPGVVCVVQGINQFITSQVGGYVRQQSQMVTIETFPLKWQVKRLDSDFESLREHLLKIFPQSIVPPLPALSKKKLTTNQTAKRMMHFQRFLNCLMKSSVLKTSKFLVAFLSETSQEKFNMRLLTIEEEQGPKNIYEFQTLKGEIEVDKSERANKFCDQLGSFARNYERINSFITTKTKELQQRSHQIADDYFAIAAEIKHFAELLNAAEIPQIVNFYNRLSDQIVKNGDYQLHSGELMNQAVGSWFKYQRQEAKCFKEAHWLRDESYQRLVTTQKNLMSKKEKIFKDKNVHKWEVKDSQLREAQDIVHDRVAAFDMMLPQETKKLEYLTEESAYFTNQSWKESRRVVMQDYAMSREHFVDMGEQMHRHIYELNLSWGQFLDYYTDLNNARKEQDDTYAEQNYIGEEVIEPDQLNPRNYDAATPSEEIQKAVSEQLDREYDQDNMLNSFEDQEVVEEERKEPVQVNPTEVVIGEKLKHKKSKVILDD